MKSTICRRPLNLNIEVTAEELVERGDTANFGNDTTLLWQDRAVGEAHVRICRGAILSTTGASGLVECI